MEVSLCTTILWSNKCEKEPSVLWLKGINGFSGLHYGMQIQTLASVMALDRNNRSLCVPREALQQATFLLNM